VSSVSTGFGFTAGADNIKLREEEMRKALALQRNGRPRLQVVVGRCPNFCNEIESFRKKTVRVGSRNVPTDEGNRRVNTHSIEAVEQALALGVKYCRPISKAIEGSLVDAELARERKREHERAMTAIAKGGNSGISLGPVGAS
jgi:hypothetical protein